MIGKTEVPDAGKYYWFVGVVHRDGDMQGYVKIRGLAYIGNSKIAIDNVVYSSDSVSGGFFGPLPDPPWKFEIEL